MTRVAGGRKCPSGRRGDQDLGGRLQGILGARRFVTLDYYNGVAENFITDLLPQLGTPLGRINPNFGPWQPPPGLPPLIATIIRTQVPPLSNNFDGSNVLVAASFTNFGGVDTQGIDTALNYYVTDAWTLSVRLLLVRLQDQGRVTRLSICCCCPIPPATSRSGPDLPALSLRRSIQFPLGGRIPMGRGTLPGRRGEYTTVRRRGQLLVEPELEHRHQRQPICSTTTTGSRLAETSCRRRVLTSVAFGW